MVVELVGAGLADEGLVDVQTSEVARSHSTSADLLHDIIAIVEELRGHAVDGLAGAAAEGVVDKTC